MTVEHFYQDIEGWFDFEDLYREAVRRMPEGSPTFDEMRRSSTSSAYTYQQLRELGPHSTMVEVGVYKGRSCFFLAVEALNSGKNIHVIAVDRFTWPPSGQADFSRLRREHGLTEMISMIEATSVQAAHQFDDGEIDFVFIDADHEYKSVKADIAAWWPKIKPGGILAGHDFCDEFPGVEHAVRERFPKDATDVRAEHRWQEAFQLWPPRSWWVDKR